MQTHAQDEYLTMEVMAASPQRLQLMVLDVALRECQRSKKLREARQEAEARKALLRSQDAISMLLTGLKYDANSPLVGRVAGVYLFVYKSLLEAQLKSDTAKLADAIRILEIERETWRQVCERNGATRSPASDSAPAAAPPTHAKPQPHHRPHSAMSFVADSGTTGSSLSFEA